MSKSQYTIRNIPSAVDKVLRNRAQREAKSLNAVVVEALTLQTLGNTDVEKASQDVFDRLRGANTLDSGFDAAIKDQSGVHDA